MAADVCSDFPPSLVSSPRISFSHDLQESNINIVSVECSHPRSDNFKVDFDFSFNPSLSSSSPTISSADELFSNGKILPGEIKKIPKIIQSPSRKSRLTSIPISKSGPGNTKMLKDFLTSSVDEDEDEVEDDEEEDKKPPTRQFWQFRRTSSLNSVNSENGRKNTGIIKSFQFLSRSNSTGSAPHPKMIVQQKATPKMAIARSISHKECSIKRTGSQKDPKIMPRSASVSSSTQYYAFNSGKKAFLRKSYSNVIRINPVLNITPTYFTKGNVNLFGFCSFLSNSKSNKKKK